MRPIVDNQSITYVIDWPLPKTTPSIASPRVRKVTKPAKIKLLKQQLFNHLRETRRYYSNSSPDEGWKSECVRCCDLIGIGIQASPAHGCFVSDYDAPSNVELTLYNQYEAMEQFPELIDYHWKFGRGAGSTTRIPYDGKNTKFVSRDFESGLYIDYFDNVPIDLVVRFIASHGGIKCDV